MSKQSLLLVDGDTRSLRVLEVSLRKAGFMVTSAVSVQDALDKLELHVPDLIISETTFPDGDGFELRRRVRATPEWAEIPFIFLTAEAAIENKIRGLELGVDDYLTKPIYIKEIVTRINILLQKRQRTRFEERRDGRTRFAGRVQDMPVVDVIQTIEISRKSGVIQFVGERGRQAAIYFRDGRVIDAEAGALQGEDAVYRLLTWSEGEFEVVFRTVRRREVITKSSQALLMEGMRRLDEWSRLFEQLPPLTHRFEVDTIELAARLGDVPDDNNRILRLFDGKRALLEVIDGSDVGDLECLQAISRLYFEELLIDLDHGRAPRRDTGKSVALVAIDGPTPLGEEISGPVAAATGAAAAGDTGEPAPAQGPGAAVPQAAAAVPQAAAAVPQAAAAVPQARVVAALAAVAASAALDDAPGEDGFDDAPGEGAFDDTGADVSAEDVPPADDGSGDRFADDGSGDGFADDGSGDDAPAEDTFDDASEPVAVGPLMGGYRRSSLRLIDEAVAAAQAIEPALFDDAAEANHQSNGHSGNGISRTALTADAASALAAEVAASGGDASGTAERVGLEQAGNLRAAEREDSGLRMIGSLGRDRAEASGELAPLGQARPLRSETARELVTILPRRITRELPLLAPELAESLPTPTPTSPVLAARPASALEAAEPTLRVARPGSGVRAPSRSRRLLRVVHGGGPGVGAMLLILLAAVLAGTAVLLRLRRHTPSMQSSELVRDTTAPGSQASGATNAAGASDGTDEPTAPTSAARGSTSAVREATGAAGEMTNAGRDPTSAAQDPSGGLGVTGAGRDPSGGGRDTANGDRAAASAGSGPAARDTAAGGRDTASSAPDTAAGGRDMASGAVGAGSGGLPVTRDTASAGPGPASGGVGAGSGATERGSASAGRDAGNGSRDTAGGSHGATRDPTGASRDATQPTRAASGSAAAGTARELGGAAGSRRETGSGEGGARSSGTTGDARNAAGQAGSGARPAAGRDRTAEAKLLCDQASNALDEGDFARAFELTSESLKLRRTARAYMLRARAEQRLNRVDAALASLDAATELAPSSGAVWEQRGRILWAARRRDEARAAFERFLELDPKSPKAPEVLRMLNEPR